MMWLTVYTGMPGLLPSIHSGYPDPSHASEVTEASVKHHAPLQQSPPTPWELEGSARGRKLASLSSPRSDRTNGMQGARAKQLGWDSWAGTAAWVEPG